jgi:hypothetical protein
MNILTHHQLTELVAAKRGAVILSIISLTEPKFRKTGCPFSTLQKVEYKRVVVGANYGRAVNKQIAEVTGNTDAPAFVVSPRKWGEYLVPDKVVEYLGNLYLSTQARNPQKAIKTTWIADGREVSKETVVDYLATSNSAKQEARGLHGKKQVMVRDFKMSSVLKVMVNGKEYILIPDMKANMNKLAETLQSLRDAVESRQKDKRKSVPATK